MRRLKQKTVTTT